MKTIQKILGLIISVVLVAGVSYVGFQYYTTSNPAWTNWVYPSPYTKTMYVNQSFTSTIYCKPVQPIKGWELKIYFNATLLQVLWIKEGNYASQEGYESYFTPNYVIDNINGTISKIYGVILGAGNLTSKKCTLITIRFKAIARGISPLLIRDVGLCNSTEYIPVLVSDGRIIIK